MFIWCTTIFNVTESLSFDSDFYLNYNDHEGSDYKSWDGAVALTCTHTPDLDVLGLKEEMYSTH